MKENENHLLMYYKELIFINYSLYLITIVNKNTDFNK